MCVLSAAHNLRVCVCVCVCVCYQLYQQEDVALPPIVYSDNQDVLDLLTKKPTGLIPMLDEEGSVPRGSWETFLVKFTRQHAASRRLRFRTGNKCFGINHYAGDVTYDPCLFIVKNKDTLSGDLLEAMAGSSLPFVAALFASKEEAGSSSGAVSNKVTVGSNFRQQLESLILNLNATQPR